MKNRKKLSRRFLQAALSEFVAWIEDNRSLMLAPAGCGKENYDWLLKNVYLVPHTFDEVLTILELEDNRVVTFQTLEVRKTSFLRQFDAKTRTFDKTGSGQTQGK